MQDKKLLHKIFQSYYDWVIHPDLKKLKNLHQKARVLCNVYLLFAVFSIFVIISNLFITPDNDVPTFLPAIFTVIMIGTFKWKGNLNLSGNILAALYVISLAPSTLTTGGLYSDNLIWMGAAPFIAFLFASRFSGLFWLIVLELFTMMLFFMEINGNSGFKDQIKDYPPEYYWISWSLLFLVFTFIVYLFAKGESKIIEQLQEKEMKLTKQKTKLSKQADALRQNENQLKELNKNMEHFVYAVSHDLKEPLRMIKMYTQLLNKNLGSQLTPNNAEFMSYVLDGTVRMQQMLEGLLHYSRLNKSNDHEKDVNLEDIIVIVKNNLAFSIQDKNAIVETDGKLPTIKGHSTFLMQLFQNLISNAIKFQHKDRVPVIRVECKESQAGYTLNVIDNGIGIKEEFQSRIFEIFAKLHNRAEYDGSGIGLATCKKIVSNMGGTITLKSVVGEGTTFRIWLPKKNKEENKKKAELQARMYN